MSRQFKTNLAFVLVIVSSLTGCHPTQPFFLQEDGDLSHYLDQVQEIEYPDVHQASLAEVEHSLPPLTVAKPDFKETWDLTLEETISIALQNSKIIRNSAVVSQPGVADSLLGRTVFTPTVYDPAIVSSTVTGQNALTRLQSGALGRDVATERVLTSQLVGGVEDALAEFDTHASAIYNYGKSERPQNIASAGTVGGIRSFDTANFDAALSKKLATGGVVSISNQVAYSRNRLFQEAFVPPQLVPSDYTAVIKIEARHPLLRGRGTQFNRIPVVLARINEDISVIDFEIAVRNLLLDIENNYWDLHCAYRTLETAMTGRDSALGTWRKNYEEVLAGKKPKQVELQAREQYFFFRAQLETSLADLYENEARVRWLLGLAPSDGRMIRPKDDPTSAMVEFDWLDVSTESRYRTAELRQQRWRMKQRELELIQARNQLLPSLNLTASHSWVGVGDELISADRKGFNFVEPPPAVPAGSTAYDELTEGKYTESFVGLEFLPPAFGARRELARIRNAQLQQSREKARLEDMELHLTHLLSTALRNKDRNYRLAQSHLNRWAATEREIESAEEADKGKGVINNRPTTDILLDAQRRRAQAQFDYYRALCDYNKAIADIHRHKGSILEYSGVVLSEGPWPDKAYWDALEKARQRDASYYLDYGYTRPAVVSRGRVPQGGAAGTAPLPGQLYIEDERTLGEEVPTPALEGERSSPQTPELEELPEGAAPPEAPPQPGAAPITTLPDGPLLAPPARRAAAPARQPSYVEKTGAFRWGPLGLGGTESFAEPVSTPARLKTADPTDAGNPLRRAGYSEPLR